MVIATAAAYGIALTAAGIGVRFRADDAKLAVVLLAFGIAAVELTRRSGEPAGFHRDAHGIWMLPMAVLLPPFYCIAVQLLVGPLVQWRIRRYVIHRRVYNATVHGLSYGAASAAFHALAHRFPPLVLDPDRAWTMWALAISACALLRLSLNRLLVLIAVRGSDASVNVRTQILDGDQLYNDLSELTAGVLLALVLAATRSLPLVVLALPLVTSLQRSLRHAQLVDASRIDAKTGLLNAVAWQREARVEISRAARTRAPLAVAMLDIDHFKQVNDTYGHLTGDAVLAALSATLRALLRDYDVVGRFGGEEFAVLLPNTDAVSAEQITERLRGKLAEITVTAGNGSGADIPLGVTVSIGVATLADSHRDLDELIAAADDALYEAKAQGRNRVCLISGGPTGIA